MYEARWPHSGDYREGHIGVYDAEREARADKARARIAELEAELEKAEDELHALYAGPKPEVKL